jgi:Ca2+/Na+ antiporter
MNPLLKEIRRTVLFAAQKLKPEAHTLLFVLPVPAVVPRAALLSHATESVAVKTGDTVGGLLNATLGNLTELVIALTALHAGQYTLVKASIAGAIVTNTLFMLGASVLLGGLKHHVQEFNRASARLEAAWIAHDLAGARNNRRRSRILSFGQAVPLGRIRGAACGDPQSAPSPPRSVPRCRARRPVRPCP